MRTVIVTAALASAAVLTGFASRPERSGLEYFSDLMPVFGHPRCANCHGAVDPLSGSGHGGGAIDAAVKSSGELADNEVCLSCHTAETVVMDNEVVPLAPEHRWRLPPAEMKWASKNLQQTCEQIAAWAERAGEGVADHLGRDPLIAWAFEGKRAGASDLAEPPDLAVDEFAQRFRAWRIDGELGCDPPARWTGSVTVELITNFDTTREAAGGGQRLRENTKSSGVLRRSFEVRADTVFAMVSGTERDTNVRHNLNVGGANCGFAQITTVRASKYSGPRKRVAGRIEAQSGVPDGFVLRLPAIGHTTEMTTTTERKGGTCGLVDGVQTGVVTLPASDPHQIIMIVDKALTLKGLTGNDLVQVLAGSSVDTVGKSILRRRWDLARKKSSSL